MVLFSQSVSELSACRQGEHHLHQHDAEHLVYHIAKPRQDGPRALVLTPLDLIDKLAALAPLPMPVPAAGTPKEAPHRAAARYLWAMLSA